MKLLVTGARGFIGRHVVDSARKRGHDVRALQRTRQPGDADAAGAVIHDLREPAGLAEKLAGVDAVIHCAAAMSGDFEHQRAMTVDGTRNLLDAMARAGVRHIVGISSFAVYDYRRIPTHGVLDEDAPLETRPQRRAPYIGAKLEQERMIRLAATERGWRFALLRPGLVFGPDRTWFYHLGMKLTPTRWVVLAGSSLLPLTYVENCADAIVLAAERPAADGATINVVDDALPPRRAYVEALAGRESPRPRLTDVPWTILSAPSAVASGLNRLVGEMLPLPGMLSDADLHARSKPLRYSNARAKQLLEWKPRVDWKTGLSRS